jgi:hypothetical protein
MIKLTAQKLGYQGVTLKQYYCADEARCDYNDMRRSEEYVYIIVKQYNTVVASHIHPLAHRDQKRLRKADDKSFTFLDPRFGSEERIPIINLEEQDYEH